MSENVISNALYISVIEDLDNTSYYYFSINQRNVLKFYTSLGKIRYMPSQLEYRLVQQNNGIETTVLGIDLIVTVIGKDKNNNDYFNEIVIKQEAIVDADGALRPPTTGYIYTFPSPNEDLVDIEKITFKAKQGGLTIAYEEILVMYGTSQEMAKLSLYADGLYASVNEAGFSFTSSGLTVNNGKITVRDKNSNEVFRVNTDGDLYFAGTIESKSGTLSGWILQETELIDNSRMVGIHSGSSRLYNNNPIRFWAGSPIVNNVNDLLNDESFDYDYNFVVTQNGFLYANDAQISGQIEARSGRILGDFYVGENNNGIIIHADNQNVDKSYIGSIRYASGPLNRGGWTINADGSAEFNNVSIRGKITSSVFEHNHISSVGGSLFIAPTFYTDDYSSNIIVSDQNSPNTYQVTWSLKDTISNTFGGKPITENSFLLIDGDVIINETINHLTNILAVIKKIPKESEPLELIVEFHYEDILLAGKRFQPGTTIVLYGTPEARNGLYLTATGPNAPYIEIYNNFEATENLTTIPAVRLGNLQGIRDSQFAATGENLSGYGLYSNNVFLSGELALPHAGITNQNKSYKNNSAIRFWAGLEDLAQGIHNANFIVTEDGSLYANKGEFTGIIKATNSEFSGNIRAAGILLDDKNSDTTQNFYDHFYVAYNILKENETEFQPSYSNYVLNIDKDGLSIWEGGLQAYSDYANILDYNGQLKPQYSAYQYDNIQNTAFPFLYLVDEGNDQELLSRLIVTKLHTVNFIPFSAENDQIGYNSLSVQLNNGLWLFEANNIGNDFKGFEKELFNRPKNTGLTLEQTKFILKNNTVNGTIHLLSPSGVCINGDSTLLSEYTNNALLINGNVQIINNTLAELKINKTIVKEAKINGNSVGLNFIAVS